MNDRLADYVDVAERIAEFRAKYPNGSLRPAALERPFWVEDVPGIGPRLVYVAAAYRGPEDTNPGVGSAWEPLPGRTPYTRDSELMVAETSAWGRAIVATLAADTHRGIASRDEVRARQSSPKPTPKVAQGEPVEIDLTTAEGRAKLAEIAAAGGAVEVPVPRQSVEDEQAESAAYFADRAAGARAQIKTYHEKRMTNPDGPPSEKQLAMLRGKLTGVGLVTNELATGYLSDLLGREITGASDLTKRECSTAIDALMNDGQGKTTRSNGPAADDPWATS